MHVEHPAAITLAAYPTAPNLAELPVHCDRRTGAELIKRFYFSVSPRTLEAWPLPTRRVNGKAIYVTAELLAYARAMLDAAPTIRGGRGAKATA
jgi:hypothetical protein